MTRPAPWSIAEDATLRELWPDLDRLTAALQRSRCAIRCRGQKIGLRLSRRRAWTERERQYVRDHYGRETCAQVAAALERGESSVYQQADLMGLTRKRVRTDAAFDRKVQERHTQGWSDAEIADELGCERHAVGRARKRLGLPPNTLSEHRRRRVAERTRQQLASAGLSTLADLREQVLLDRGRQAALELGVPADCAEGVREPEAQILALMSDGRPRTRQQMCKALGWPWKGIRKSMTCNQGGGTYTATLISKGLLLRVPKGIRTGAGRGHKVDLYVLPQWLTAAIAANRRRSA